MTKSQARKLLVIALLFLLLALLGGYYAYYKSTHKLSFNLVASTGDTLQPPQFLYSFAGDNVKLQRPIGVTVVGNEVFVCDASGRAVFVFTQDGKYLRSFGQTSTVIPLYCAKNPKDGLLYVTDRRTRSIHRFTLAGQYVNEFDPNLPKDQLPDFKTGNVQWAPVGIAFGPDGTMYVSDILASHRILIFGPDGKFEKSVGEVGQVTDRTTMPLQFEFPNGIAVHSGLVYVTDSNNGRVQVLDKDGNFKQIIVTQGLPRGIAFLNPFPGDRSTTSARFVVVDTLSHDGTLWNVKGTKLVDFGQQGVLDGQFSYPDGAAVGSRNRIFIADTSNGRVQVWGWPEQVSPVPVPQASPWWALCLSPLLLLPLLLLLRKKKFYTTPDFVYAMKQFEQLDLMPDRRRKWLVSEEHYEELKIINEQNVDMSELLEAEPYSESDVQALMDKLEIDKPTAIVLALAQRAHVFTTENPEYRRLAKSLEIDVVNREEFLERFAKPANDTKTPPTGPSAGEAPPAVAPAEESEQGVAPSEPGRASAQDGEE